MKDSMNSSNIAFLSFPSIEVDREQQMTTVSPLEEILLM